MFEVQDDTVRRTPPPLQIGDEVTMAVEGIGTITNTVTEGTAPSPVPPARARPT